MQTRRSELETAAHRAKLDGTLAHGALERGCAPRWLPGGSLHIVRSGRLGCAAAVQHGQEGTRCRRVRQSEVADRSRCWPPRGALLAGSPAPSLSQPGMLPGSPFLCFDYVGATVTYFVCRSSGGTPEPLPWKCNSRTLPGSTWHSCSSSLRLMLSVAAGAPRAGICSAATQFSWQGHPFQQERAQQMPGW